MSEHVFSFKLVLKIILMLKVTIMTDQYFENLPNDVRTEILCQLPLWQINELACCSKAFDTICWDENLWKRLWTRDYPKYWRDKSQPFLKKYYGVEEEYHDLHAVQNNDTWDNSKHDYCISIFKRLKRMFTVNELKGRSWNVYTLQRTQTGSKQPEFSVISNSEKAASMMLTIIYWILNREDYVDYLFESEYLYDNASKVGLTESIRKIIDRFMNDEHIKVVNLSSTNVSSKPDTHSSVKNILRVEVWSFKKIKKQLFEVLKD